jgi:hypothetical protein
MTKVFKVTGSIQEWASTHSFEIHKEILNACEINVAQNYFFVEVILIKTKKGVTRFILEGKEKIIKSLNLSLEYFVMKEEYELAARTRDCITSWKEKE